MKDAKTLAAKPAANDADRAYNMDLAIQMAKKAVVLHGGPYSVWEMGEHADKLLKELQEARAKLKVQATGTAVAGRGPTGGTQQGAGADQKKQAAIKLMSEGRLLADQGNFAAARVKYTEAEKLGAPFAPNEYSPGFAQQELNNRGKLAMDKLLRDAQAFSAQKDYGRADAALANAGQIATTLGLYLKPVVEAKATLYVSSSGQFGTPSPSGIAAAGGPDRLVRADPLGVMAAPELRRAHRPSTTAVPRPVRQSAAR